MGYIWFGLAEDEVLDPTDTAQNNKYRSDIMANLYIAKAPDYEVPDKNVDSVEIPGRNGSIIFDNETYKNVTRSYSVSVYKFGVSAAETSAKLAQWLRRYTNYRRLYDTYEPDVYRLAIAKSSFSITNLLGVAGTATLSFECKPERFLRSGDTKTQVSSGTGGTNFTNDYFFDSRPLIIVTNPVNGGTITVTNNGVSSVITFNTSAAGVYYIDCDTCVVYYIENNIKKPYVNVLRSTSPYPSFGPGTNNVKYSSGFGKVEVIPRWWTL